MAVFSLFKDFWYNAAFGKIMLFTLTFLLYANTLTHEYTQDDAIVIYDNMYTTKGIDGIPGILENDTFFGFFKEEGKAKLVSGGRYRPVSMVFFAIEWELFGNNPFPGHLINVLLFSTLVLLLYSLLLLLFAPLFNKKDLGVFALIAALLFAVHPIHTEVVANIKGRDEILSLLFSLLSLFLLIKYLDKNKLFLLITSLLSFLIALLAKENAITFLAVFPLAVFLFRKVSLKQQLGVFSSMLLAGIVFLVIRSSVLGWDFGGRSLELMNNPFLKIVGGKYVDFSAGEKFSTIIFTLGKYLQLLLFPHPLTHDYYPRQIAIMHFGDWRVLLSFFSYAFLLIYSILNLKKNKVISFGILYFLLTISIVSNIVFPIGTNMSERFLFMPSVGFVIIMSSLLLKVKKVNKSLFSVVIIGIVILLGLKTFTRNQVWKDDFTLFTTDVKTSKNSAKVLNAAGGALVTKATTEENELKKNKMLRKAISYLDKAVKIHPNYKSAYLIKGNANYYLRDFPEAINAFSKTLRLAPGYEEAKNNLAISHREAGKYYGQEKNDLKKALQHLQKAFEMMPENYETVRLYGIAQALSGNSQAAIELFKKGIELEKDNAGAFVNLGNVYYNIGDMENGKFYHTRALELDPEVFTKNN